MTSELLLRTILAITPPPLRKDVDTIINPLKDLDVANSATVSAEGVAMIGLSSVHHFEFALKGMVIAYGIVRLLETNPTNPIAEQWVKAIEDHTKKTEEKIMKEKQQQKEAPKFSFVAPGTRTMQ